MIYLQHQHYGVLGGMHGWSLCFIRSIRNYEIMI